MDYDEAFPFSWNGSCCDNRPNGTGWASQLYPYVKSTGVYACPDDQTAPNPNVVYYYYNCNICGGNLGSLGSGYGMAFGDSGQSSKLVAPTKTVLLCECTGITSDVTNPTIDSPATSGSSNVTIGRSSITFGQNLLGVVDYGNGTTGPATGLMVTGPLAGAGTFTKLPVHGGNTGSNYLMADGHVKFLNGSKVSPGHTYYLTAGGSNLAASYGQGYTFNAEGTGVGTAVATFSVL